MSVVRGLVRRADGLWLIAALLAGALLLATIFFPLWRMELVAPQYPEGLVMYAYGHKFSDDASSPYLDVREINGLNHYIGMKPIEEVTEMQLFIPGVLATAAAAVLVSFIGWKRRWLQGLIAAGFWFMPFFFLADLQFWLYNYGHTMNEEAPLNPGDFTPKVIGTTEVWNFHSETSLQFGFFLMIAAALVITVAPPALRWYRGRRARAESERRKAAPLRMAHSSKRSGA